MSMSRSCRRSSTFRSDSGKRTYIMTARRMISGLLRKYLKGPRFVMAGGYEAALPASTGFLLTKPNAALVQQAFGIPERRREPDIHHHCQADDLGAGFEPLEWAGFGHGLTLASALPRLKPSYSDKIVRDLTGTLHRSNLILVSHRRNFHLRSRELPVAPPRPQPDNFGLLQSNARLSGQTEGM